MLKPILKLSFLSLFVVALLASCSQRFTLGFIDTFALWQIEKYVTLTDEQEESTRRAIKQVLNDIADTDAPLLLELLEETRYRFQNQEIEEDWLEHEGSALSNVWQGFRQKHYAAIESFLISLSESQKQQMLTVLRERLDEDIAEYEAQGTQERLVNRRVRFEETVERFVGRVTPAQRRIATRLTSETPDLNSEWLDYRRRWLNDFEQAMMETDPMVQQSQLRVLMTSPEQLRSQALQNGLRVSRERSVTTLLEIEKTLTDRQRSHFLRELNKWEKQLNSFIELYATDAN